MQILEGIATNSRCHVAFGNQGSSRYQAILQLNGKPIVISSSEPVMIEDGDCIAIVGVVKKGIFKAVAYKNKTTHIEGNEGGWIIYLGLGVVSIVMPASNLHKFLLDYSFFGVFPLIVTGIFFLVGLTSIFYAIRLRAAINKLDTFVSSCP